MSQVPLTMGEKIRYLRRRLRMTQAQLAGKDFTKSFISQIEKNQARPSLKTISIIAARLQRPISFFLQDAPTQDGTEGGRVDQALLSAREFVRTKRWDELLEVTATGLSSCPPHDYLRRGRLYRFRGRAFWAMNDIAQALEALELAAEEFRLAQDVEARSEAYFRMGYYLTCTKRYREAIEAYERSLFLVEDCDHESSHLIRILTNLGISCAAIARYQAARKYLERAMRESVQTSEFYKWGEICHTLGVVEQHEGNLAKALDETERALHFYQSVGDQPRIADAKINLGTQHAQMGSLQAARQELEEALALASEVGYIKGQVSALQELGGLALQENSLADAARLLNKALELDLSSEDAARVHRLLTDLHRRSGDLDKARQHCEEAIAILASLDRTRELAEAYSDLGMLHQAMGADQAAREALLRSIELFKQAPGEVP